MIQPHLASLVPMKKKQNIAKPGQVEMFGVVVAIQSSRITAQKERFVNVFFCQSHVGAAIGEVGRKKISQLGVQKKKSRELHQTWLMNFLKMNTFQKKFLQRE